MVEQLSLLSLLSIDIKPELDQLRSADSIYDALDTRTVPIFVENRRVERKSGKVDPKVLGEYLSMWANTQPEGGVLLVGVENNGIISGLLKLGNDKKNDLEYLSRYCSDARFTSKEVPVINDKGEQDFILAYRVLYRDDKVVETSSHEAFVREGSSKIKMNDILRRELGIAKGEIRNELEAVNLMYPDDFNLDQIHRFGEAFTDYRKFSDSKTDTELLELARLGKRRNGKFSPNLACALLFAHDPCAVIPGSMIRILRYDGTKEEFGKDLNVIFDSYADGPIPKMLEQARQKISSQIRSYQRLTGSKLERRQEYPEAAWYEAVVNAVGHRSYNLKAQNIFVKMFNDRIVVESPGGFVPPTTSQSIYESHNPRNRVLMDAMMHLDLTHCGYEGTRRMLTEMTRANLPAPKFVQIEASAHQVHVTLRNTPIEGHSSGAGDSVITQMGEEEFAKLEREERQILGYLVEYEFITITKAASITGRSRPTAQKYVRRLTDRKIIEKVKRVNGETAPSYSYRFVIPQ